VDIPRRDVVLTYKPEDQKPCPACSEQVESIRYESAIVSHADVEPRKGFVQVGFHIEGCAAAEFQPCGHRFDGATGQPIGD